jgi:hypothetical protein
MDEVQVETLLGAVNAGNRAQSLRALANLLAVSVESAEVQNRAALAKQLVDVLRELAELPEEKEGSPVDDLTAARQARRAAAKDRSKAFGGQ